MRIELIHPLLVHFPIALLTVGTLLRFLAIFYRNQLLKTSWIVLGIGAVFACLTLLAGKFAAAIVGPTLCNRFILEMHETLAYCAVFLFAGAIVLDWARAYWPQFGLYKIFSTLCFLFYLAGLCTLLFVGALGGSMVYEQGAAVENGCPQIKTH